ncbi:MAG: acyl-CoA dehydrogenase family protein [Acidimicrobiales bacterium]
MGVRLEDTALFRAEYRAWLEANIPDGWKELVERDREAAVAFAREWMQIRHAGGYGAPGWPREHGGMAASLAQQIVMYEEEQRAGAPGTGLFAIALNHAGATLIAHGSVEQCGHLGRILEGKEIWCQGFSEPNAGSDLASLRTRAVRDGDDYVVTGQKVWSSVATHADWCLLLVRTNPTAPKRKGISYLLLDLRSPGVEVRPLRQMTGSAEFCEIFLDEVRVPTANRVGPEDEGWRISQTTLSTERGPFFLASVQALRAQVRSAVQTLGPALDDPAVRQRLGGDVAEVEILAELYSQILASQIKAGEAGPESSVIKLFYTEVLHRLTGHVVDDAGLSAQLGSPLTPDDDRGGTWMLEHLQSWGMAIGGGTSDIQRNLIGERVLGLPREPV